MIAFVTQRPEGGRRQEADFVFNLIMRQLFLILLLVTALANRAFCKIGESVEQVALRYGKALDFKDVSGLTSGTYSFQNTTVTVVYYKDKSAGESIIPVDEDRKFSDEECLALAAALTGQANWKASSLTNDPADPNKTWLADGFIAERQVLPSKVDKFSVTTQELADYLKEDRARKIKEFADKFSETPPPPSTNAIMIAATNQPAASAADIAQEKRARAKAEAAAAALKFWQAKAESGDDNGQYRLGLIYLRGTGVSADPQKARELFEKSAAQGNPEAAKELAKLTAVPDNAAPK
jgi:TPR repeat protein